MKFALSGFLGHNMEGFCHCIPPEYFWASRADNPSLEFLYPNTILVTLVISLWAQTKWAEIVWCSCFTPVLSLPEFQWGFVWRFWTNKGALDIQSQVWYPQIWKSLGFVVRYMPATFWLTVFCCFLNLVWSLPDSLLVFSMLSKRV